MDRIYIINRIAILTNTNVNNYDDLGDGILRRIMILFDQDVMQDAYNIKLYYKVASKHFAQKGDQEQEQEQKYANMAIGMAIGMDVM